MKTVIIVGSICIFSGRIHADLLTFPKNPVDGQLLALQEVIDDLHRKALRSRKPWSEEDLRKKLPARYRKLEKRYAKIKDERRRAQALAQLALLYADLAWVERVRPLVETVNGLEKTFASRLGFFDESEHFLVRVVGTDAKWATAALKLAEAARDGYLELFGFRAISKVPGKKIRILIHVDPDIKKSRLYFHPSPPYHSELRYEIPDEALLTRHGGRRLVYGICHELGHMVAMWGQHGGVEDDKHAWAHYTGCLIVEEVYKRLGNEPWPTWTSFQRQASGKARLLKQIHGHDSGKESYESILALFYRIGEQFGTDAYGRAWKWLEGKRRFRRMNNVPYLWLRDLEEALVESLPGPEAKRVPAIFGTDR